MAEDKVTIIIEAKDQASGAFQKAGGALGKMAAVAGGVVVGGLAAGAAGLGFLSVKAIQAGSDAQEMLGKFNTVFGSVADFATNELAQMADAIGRNRFDLMEYAATLQDTFVPLGFVREEAADMSIELVGLAEDLASFNNLETADVVRDLQTAMVGNTEVLRKYGVVAQQAQIEQFALETKLWDGEEAMTAQQKAIAILGLTYQGTTDAQGDATRTAGSFANQMRALKSSVSETVTELGMKLLPVVTPVLNLFKRLADMVGDKVAKALDKAQPFLDGMAAAMEAFTSGRITDGLAIVHRAINDLFEAFGVSGPVKDIVLALSSAIQSLVVNLMDGMDPIESIKWAIASFIEAFTGSEESMMVFVDAFDNVRAKVAEFMGPIVEFIQNNIQLKDVLAGLAIVLAGVVLSAIISLVTAIGPVLLAIGAAIAIVALLRTAWENDWGGIQEKVQAVITFIQNIVTTIMTAIRTFWEENGQAILASAQAVWDAIMEAINTVITTVQTIITTVVTAIRTFWEENGEAILASAQAVWDAIMAYVDLVTAQIKTLVEAFQAAFRGDWEEFGEKLREVWDRAWNTIKEVVSTIGPKILEFIEGLVEDIKSFFTDTDWGQLGSDIIEGIASGITAAAGFIVDAAKAAAQAAVDAVTGFLGIESPSKVFQGLGLEVVKGFSLGIVNNKAMVSKAMVTMAKAATVPSLSPGIVGPSQTAGQALSLGQSGGKTVKEYHVHIGSVSDDTFILNDFRLMEATAR